MGAPALQAAGMGRTGEPAAREQGLEVKQARAGRSNREPLSLQRDEDHSCIESLNTDRYRRTQCKIVQYPNT